MYKILLCFIVFLLYSCGVSSPSSMKSTKKPTTIKTNIDSNTTELNKPKSKAKANTKPEENKTNSKKEEKQQKVTPPKQKIRFEDTTKIEMEPIYALKQNVVETNNNNPIEKEIEYANKLLENREIEKAKEKFSILAATLPYGDSLYYEAKFGEIECLIAQKKISDSQKLLQDLLKDKNINPETEEKALVRLGQIECIQNNQTSAENYFNQLRNKYPRSIYLKVANCNFMKKK